MTSAARTGGAKATATATATPAVSPVAYCLLVVAFPALGILACLLIANTDWFRRDCKDSWFDRGDVAYTSHGAACDILIFGDSTAVTGLDTQLIAREAQLRTCNIAQTLGVLSVLGFAPLDRFLDNNPRPKYLVLQFAGDDLAPFEQWSGSYVEGLYDLLEFFPPAMAARGMVEHPDSFFALSRAVVTLASRQALRALRRKPAAHGPRTAPSELPDAFFTVPQPPWQACDPRDDGRRPHPPDAAWVKALRARYLRSADHVLIEIAPTADCDPGYAAVSKANQGLTDNSYERFPIRMFNDGLVHFSAEGSARLSRELVSQIIAPTPRLGSASLNLARVAPGGEP